MQKIIFCLISLFLGLLLLIFSIQQAGVSSVLKIVSLFPPSIILVVFVINFTAICLIGSMRWKIIIESQNTHKISFLKILAAKLAGFTVSYITPSAFIGGEPVRAYMIKEENNCSWEKSFASVVIDQAIYFFTLFLFMIIGFLFLADHFLLPRSIFYGFGTIVILSIAVLYLFYLRLINENPEEHGFFIFIIKTLRLDKIKFIKNKEENINKMERIILQFFRHKKSALLKAFVLAVLETMCCLAIVWIIALYLGTAVDFIHSVSIFFMIALANFVPIPGSIGSFEAALTFIFDLLGFEKSNGFVLSLIFRLINIMLVSIGFAVLIYFEIKMLLKNSKLEASKLLFNIHKTLNRLVCRK